MSVDGAWNLIVKSPMGDQTSTMTLKAEGGVLTGSAMAGGDTSPITDGKVDGDNLSWSNAITSPFPMTLVFSGAVAGDKIEGSVKAGSFGSFPFTGERA